MRSGLLILALAAPLSAPRVVVESNSACPAAPDVETRLAALLPPLEAGAVPERAAIVAEGEALRIHLVGGDGAAVGDRTLTVAASCADRANVVAVVIAAWEAERAAQQVQAPSLAPPPAPSPAAVVATPAPAVVATPPLVVELSLGPSVTFLAGGAAPSGALAVAVWGRRLGARATLFGLWPRTDAVGPGQARWSRAGASFEAAVRARGRAGRFDAHAGLVAAVLVAAGTGFDSDATTAGLSPGLAAGVDWSYAFGRVFVGVGAGAVGWTDQRLLWTTAAEETKPFPRVQVSGDGHVGVVF
jgi:hypothetical protein